MKTRFLSSLPLVLFTLLPCFHWQSRLPVIQFSSIYGYNNSIVMAAVTNANKDQIAHTSFETTTDKGYWTYGGSTNTPGRTGNLYYPLGNGRIQRTGLLKGKYIVSYWANASATVTGTNYTLISEYIGTTVDAGTISWTYYESIFSLSADNSSITLAGTLNMDELRLYPFDAQMTTYTYDPLIGKTSETDANNVTTFYEYDEFNRLKRVKDQYGNIIKQNVYHYKGQ